MTDGPGALFADLYEFTMMEGYFRKRKNPGVVFDMFFRKAPFGGGWAVFAGLAPLLEALSGLAFHQSDLAYLDSLGLFHRDFLDWLAAFRFGGDLYAMPEGTIVFPHEPLLRVHASLLEAQLVESLILNGINFQTLIATKAARVFLAGNKGHVIEFGLRRAQGTDGALSASRASFIGGAEATSNTLAGKIFNIPVRGTMSHSWVMAFANEAEAFEAYAEVFPGQTILLIDTYDTLRQGLPHAIAVGKKLAVQGIENFGVRLDSGNLLTLSRAVRRELDRAGLINAHIIASNELDEESIARLVRKKAPIDAWGVGTRLVTGSPDASLSGVYKLVAKEEKGTLRPVIKISDNTGKMTNPGVKQVFRCCDENSRPLADLIALQEEAQDSLLRGIKKYIKTDPPARIRPLLELKMKNGRAVTAPESLVDIRARTQEGLALLPPACLRISRPRFYPVYETSGLAVLKKALQTGARIQGGERNP